VAFAGVCKSALTGRPAAAFVFINLQNIDLVNRSSEERVFTTLLHEVTHGMGFVSSYLGAFLDR